MISGLKGDIILGQHLDIQPFKGAVEMDLHLFFRCIGISGFQSVHQLLVLVDSRIDRQGKERVVKDKVDLGAIEELFDVADKDRVARGLGNGPNGCPR